MDPLATKQTINYTGGSLTMTVGALQSLFGDALESLTSVAEEKSVSVASHSRTRVIGGSTTAVSGHTYTYMQWPLLSRVKPPVVMSSIWHGPGLRAHGPLGSRVLLLISAPSSRTKPQPV